MKKICKACGKEFDTEMISRLYHKKKKCQLKRRSMVMHNYYVRKKDKIKTEEI